MQKDRGKFLTIMLVLMILNMVYVLYSATTTNYQELYNNVPSWLSPFILVNTLVDIVALVGIWLWKKWGVYLFTVSMVVGVLMEVLFLQPKGFSGSFMGIIFIGLLFWAVSRKWKYFG